MPTPHELLRREAGLGGTPHAGEDLEQHAAERVDAGTLVEIVEITNLLGGHVARRSHRAGARFVGIELARDAPVEDVDSPSSLVVIHDRLGNYPEFAEYLHKLIARSQNALRGRWENFWSSEEMCAVRLVNREDVIGKMIYTAANPVLDRLVERVHKWPGINGYVPLLHDRAFTPRRPRHFFRANGPMPESVTFRMSIPVELGDPEDVKAQVRSGVQAQTHQSHTRGADADGWQRMV